MHVRLSGGRPAKEGMSIVCRCAIGGVARGLFHLSMSGNGKNSKFWLEFPGFSARIMIW